MSYSFKKLSEVALEQEATEANAIVEVGGEIKRMPMSAATGGGGAQIIDVEGLWDYTTLYDDDADAVFNLLLNGFTVIFKTSRGDDYPGEYEYATPLYYKLNVERREFEAILMLGEGYFARITNIEAS